MRAMFCSVLSLIHGRKERQKMRSDPSLSCECAFSISKLYKVNIPLYIFYFFTNIYGDLI